MDEVLYRLSYFIIDIINKNRVNINWFYINIIILIKKQ